MQCSDVNPGKPQRFGLLDSNTSQLTLKVDEG